MLRISEMETPRQLTAIAESKLDAGFIRPRPNYPEGVVVEEFDTEAELIGEFEALRHGYLAEGGES